MLFWVFGIIVLVIGAFCLGVLVTKQVLRSEIERLQKESDHFYGIASRLKRGEHVSNQEFLSVPKTE